MKKPLISFEFFPPKTQAGQEKLQEQQSLILKETRPEFFSVTYGAGGSTRQPTLETVFNTQSHTQIPTAPHLSCIGDSKSEIQDLLMLYKDKGIKRIVALRGDLPSGTGASRGELPYAADLVAFIRETTGDHFTIEVAGYPEVHPEATSAAADLQNLKSKVNAGANSIITQYFFNIEAFADFANRCTQLGITVPIVPGIMPITNYEKLARFSTICGAEIPRWIKKRLQDFEDDSDSLQQFGHEVVTRLCEQLITHQVSNFHFYTLNQAKPSLAICKDLSLL